MPLLWHRLRVRLLTLSLSPRLKLRPMRWMKLRIARQQRHRRVNGHQHLSREATVRRLVWWPQRIAKLSKKRRGEQQHRQRIAKSAKSAKSARRHAVRARVGAKRTRRPLSRPRPRRRGAVTSAEPMGAQQRRHRRLARARRRVRVSAAVASVAPRHQAEGVAAPETEIGAGLATAARPAEREVSNAESAAIAAAAEAAT
mmetsp:Transcript_60336/g.152782  ORF Transcript_60336/g.152782 Transcript_60336/m.152782 type:complete len:200 (-) Transcript_60336:85-684(-)